MTEFAHCVLCGGTRPLHRRVEIAAGLSFEPYYSCTECAQWVDELPWLIIRWAGTKHAGRSASHPKRAEFQEMRERWKKHDS